MRHRDHELHETRTDHEGFEPAGEVLHPVLTLVHHPDPARIGRRLVLAEGDDLVLGRGGAGFGPATLDDRWMSRRHVRVACRAGDVAIADQGSHNGTFVNGSLVDRAHLDEGDVLGIGGLLFVYGRGPASLGPMPPGMVGASPSMARVAEQIERVAEMPVTVLISGETGTGKELVARALHEQSRREGDLVSLNCGALGDGVVHSELFGHVRGSFSSADRARGGLVERAQGGTLFLDEIGDASPSLQTSLLRLLENREYRAVGSDETRHSDARFVVATHVGLADAVAAGTFREDLLSRLQRWVIEIPPLRARREDVLLLARHFARRVLGRDVPPTRRLALALLRYDWPRNVRELLGVVEQLAVEWEGGDELELSRHVAERLDARTQPTPALPVRRRRAERPGPDALRELLVDAGGNVKAVADALGIGRNTLYRWLADAGIDLDDIRAT